MGIDFYYTLPSGPCRSILMLAKNLGIELNLIDMNLREKQDHLKPEFVAINPQHCIPTLVDNGFALWESRAILEYLVQKYGKAGELYPTDLEKRTVVSQRLYFDLGVLSQRFLEFYYPQWLSKVPADPEKWKKIEEALGFLNTFLAKSEWVAGDELTIADYSIVTTISNLDVFGVDLSAYENITKWYQKMKQLPEYEENEKGAQAMKKYVDEWVAMK